MKSKFALLFLACLPAALVRADDLTVQKELISGVQQFSDGSHSTQSYGVILDFSAFNFDWGTNHTTPYVPSSISVGPLLGSTYELDNPVSGPSFLSAPTAPNANGNAFGFESPDPSIPLSFFGSFMQLSSSDPADIKPFTVTLHGGNFDQVTIPFDVDPARLPSIPFFSTANLDALNNAPAHQDLLLDLAPFAPPGDALTPGRIISLYDITTQLFPLGGNGVMLDADVNSMLFPAGTFAAGDQFVLSVFDQYTAPSDGIYYSAGTTYFFNTPRSAAVPDAGSAALYVLVGVGSLGLLRQLRRGARRPGC